MTPLENAILKEIEQRRRQRRIKLIYLRNQMLLNIIKTLFLLVIVWAIIAPILMWIWGYKRN